MHLRLKFPPYKTRIFVFTKPNLSLKNIFLIVLYYKGASAEESARQAKQLFVAQYATAGLGLSPLLTPPLNQPCLNKQGR